MTLPSKTYNIAVLPGDGIGVEVTHAALELLQALGPRLDRHFRCTHARRPPRAAAEHGVCLVA